MSWEWIVGLIISYCVGSIPTAVWIGKKFYKIDVREHGSKNAGATNTFRVLGKNAGIPVLLIDIIKGWLPVCLIPIMLNIEAGRNTFSYYQIALSSFVVLGHVFPIWAGFRGGKGVATLLGIVFAMHPLGASCSLIIFFITFIVTGYVSLGAMVSGIAFAFLINVFFSNETIPMRAIAVVFALLLLFTHRRNINRLFKGEEGKMSLFKKKN